MVHRDDKVGLVAASFLDQAIAEQSGSQIHGFFAVTSKIFCGVRAMLAQQLTISEDDLEQAPTRHVDDSGT